MRTTLNIEDEALAAVKRHADARKISLGQAASDLIYRGAGSVPQFKMKNGWVIFDLPENSPQITNETLDALEEADYVEEHRRAFSPRR